MYVLYIDESGEESFAKIRDGETSGSSPWFTLGACLFKECDRLLHLGKIEEWKTYLKKERLHATELNHFQKTYICQEMAKLDITLFGLISNKHSLTKGDNYRAQIEGEPWKYYNKNVHYLLERFGQFCGERNIPCDQQKIIFEKKRGVKYSAMKNYLRCIKNNPYNRSANFLENVNIENIHASTKNEDDLTLFSDFTAHSLFKICDAHGSHGITEQRYLKELKGKFYSDEQGMILGYGIKAVNSLQDINLQERDAECLKTLSIF